MRKCCKKMRNVDKLHFLAARRWVEGTRKIQNENFALSLLN